MTDDLWERRHQQLIEALKRAALELLDHQNITPAQMDIPLGDDLWVTIGKKKQEG